MLTMAECKEKEKQVAVASTKYGVCIPENVAAAPVKAPKAGVSDGKESNAALWIVGGVGSVLIVGLGGVLVYLAYRKGYIGKRREGSSGI